MFSLSNTITSYGDRYPEGRTEESNSRSRLDLDYGDKIGLLLDCEAGTLTVYNQRPTTAWYPQRMGMVAGAPPGGGGDL